MDKETLYARWLSGDISEEERMALSKSGEWADLESIIKTVDSLQIPKYDRTEGWEHFQKNHGRKDKPKLYSKLFSLKTLSIAAAAMLLIFAGLFLFQDNSTVINAEFAEHTTHTLPDQSTIILNSGSSINYLKDQWPKSRSLHLEGEAMFTVEEGSKFIVHTKYGNVEVLGTSFNVNAWGNDLYVECYSGKVSVENQQDRIILSKGEAIKFKDGQIRNKQTFDYGKPSWQRGMSRFMDTNIFDVFQELERQYDIDIHQNVVNKEFTGSFIHGNLEEALKQICRPMGLKSTIDSNRKSVIIE